MLNRVYYPEPLIIQPPAAATKPAAARNGNPQQSGFAELLKEKSVGSEVKLSRHAQERLRERNISFSPADMDKLTGAVNNVASKGGKESLIMLGEAALLVSINNRTVITAMERSQMQGNVFTNIDSAVVL